MVEYFSEKQLSISEFKTPFVLDVRFEVFLIKNINLIT